MADDPIRTRYLQNLHDLLPAYQVANKEMESYGTMWDELYTVWHELRSYQPDDPPHKAVYILSRCLARLEDFGETYSAVVDYQEMRRKLDEYDRRKDIENG